MTAAPDRDPKNPPTAPNPSGAGSEAPLPNLEDKQLNLQLEVERLYRQVEELRSGMQTLVAGLAIATAIAIGIASWFAYRLLSQEQIARREAVQAEAAQTEILDRLQNLEEEVDRVDRDYSQTLDKLGETSDRNQQRWQQLRDRLVRLEAAAEGEETDSDRPARGAAEATQND